MREGKEENGSNREICMGGDEDEVGRVLQVLMFARSTQTHLFRSSRSRLSYSLKGRISISKPASIISGAGAGRTVCEPPHLRREATQAELDPWSSFRKKAATQVVRF
jgi:hypothetical protein